jgi:hypothetical protein
MATILWALGFPALVIADRHLSGDRLIFPREFAFAEEGFFWTMFLGFIVFMVIDFAIANARAGRTDRVTDESFDRLEAKVRQLLLVNRELYESVERVIDTFDDWVGTVPELPSHRHAFERAIARLRQSVST